MSPLILSFLLKVQTFCDRHLIADDHWPYADVTNRQLVTTYILTGSDGLRAELRFRLKNGSVTAAEISRIRTEIERDLDGNE